MKKINILVLGALIGQIDNDRVKAINVQDLENELGLL